MDCVQKKDECSPNESVQKSNDCQPKERVTKSNDCSQNECVIKSNDCSVKSNNYFKKECFSDCPKPTVVYLKPYCQEKLIVRKFCEEVEDECGNKIVIQRECTEKITLCDDPNYWFGSRPCPPNPSINCRFTSRSIWVMAIIILIIIILVGVVLRNVYSWSNHSKIVGYVVPNSTSIWEQLKLIYFPFIIIGFILWFFIGKNTSNYIYALMLSILFSSLLMLSVLCIYESATGSLNAAVEVIVFILAAIFGVWIFYFYIVQPPYPNWTMLIAWIVLIAMFILFIILSHNHPDTPLFLPI